MPEGVREVYFSNYYRVLLVEEEDRVFISVDVYKKGFDFSISKSMCVREDFCLLYSSLDPGSYKGLLPENVLSIEVVGARTPAGLETLNVRWVVKKPVDNDLLKKIFEASWKIVGSQSPQTQ
ncbi:hypothetical protein ACSU1N_03775 [Thermogladius sp. 4427co]|uniref:hypothetical protein n=1 Tax=Thermogladius sp. 4427co TaxID=3450718 RepID=UPI003F7A817B